jgi:hypothetical protein
MAYTEVERGGPQSAATNARDSRDAARAHMRESSLRDEPRAIRNSQTLLSCGFGGYLGYLCR